MVAAIVGIRVLPTKAVCRLNAPRNARVLRVGTQHLFSHANPSSLAARRQGIVCMGNTKEPEAEQDFNGANTVRF